jgi:uncharacterized delta-60 repeat protein
MYVALLIFAIVAIGRADSGPGDLDLSLNAGSGVDGAVYSVALQADGKALIGGDFATVKGLVRSRIARLNGDGSGDGSFNPGAGAQGIVYAIAVQPSDGKILLGGAFTSFNGDSTRKYLVRLTGDGSIDPTFDLGTLMRSEVYAIALQADGKVLIGGGNPFVSGRNGIARLNANGTLDAGFDPGTGISGDGPNPRVTGIAIRPNDGKVIIVGSFKAVNGTNSYSLARLNANGSLDVDFTPPTTSYGGVVSVVLQADNKILVGGGFPTSPGFTFRKIARLNTDGSLDSSYANPTMVGSPMVLVLQPDDQKLLAAGTFSEVNGVTRPQIARFNTDGSLDLTFDPLPGVSPYAVFVFALARQTDGKLILGGDNGYFGPGYPDMTVNGRSRVERLMTSGALDTTFRATNGLNGGVGSIALQADGRIVIAGSFTTADGPSRTNLARLNSDGAMDVTFDSGTGPDDLVREVAVLTGGRILVGGGFTSINGIGRNRIARLNATGSVDSGFLAAPLTGADNWVTAFAVQPSDGKVLIGGLFQTVNGTDRNGIARLNTDGSLDTGFNPGGGTKYVYAVAVQANGQVLIAGGFKAVNGVLRNRVARLNANGSLDPGFVPATSIEGSFTSVVPQPNGKVLLGGSFPSVTRLNHDGSFDPSFTSTSTDTSVYALLVQPDGKVLISGSFTLVNGVPRKGFARLNADGSLDDTFNPGASAGIGPMLLQPDGKLLVAGGFTSMNGVARWRVARLNGFGCGGTEPLVAGVTPIRAIHVTELRACVDLARARHSLTPFVYTHPSIVPGSSVVAAVDISELRTALSQAYTAAGLTPPPYTDPGLAPGMIAKTAHVLELRSAVNSIP